jgi:hypothetical protein
MIDRTGPVYWNAGQAREGSVGHIFHRRNNTATRTVVELERTLVGEKVIQVVVSSEGGFIPKPELVIIATASIPSRDQVAPETAR